MSHELLSASAAALARLIREREISAVELAQLHLDRIAQVNPLLNAIVELDAEQVLVDAAAADRALAQGTARGPLHGVPFTVKDWIDAAGMRCTGADPAFRERWPAEDATAVARMRGAGGVLLGKTNANSGNAVYGTTNNPYNLAYSPTGSSSGEAAIIAACGSPLGLGSDSGGSIRQPAHVCGIAGLKPTTGRVPLTGHFPLISPMLDPRTVIGPLARHVEDLGLALEVIQGADWRDASVVPMPLGDWRAVELRGLRAAWYTAHADITPTAETIEATSRAAQALAEAGVIVEEATPPRIDEAYPLTFGYWNRPESASLEEWRPDGEFTLTSAQVEQHLFEWDRLRRALIGFMGRYDLILTPAAALPARPHGEDAGAIPYTLTYSLTGYPCAVVRAGTAPEGLPIGVQLVARPWRDDVALAAAHAIERALGGWQPPQLG